jgi:DNA-binding transcriptional regulator YdaS (Cro superfamily)
MTLADFLSEHGLSQAKFGAMIGVSDATINRYVKGRRAPSAVNVRKIKAITKGLVTADDLLCPDSAS